MTAPSTMYLLGAGASADAGLRVSSDLVEVILEQLRRGRDRKLAHALDFVVAVMVAHDVREGNATSSERPDIERIASAVELLSKRSELEVAPFIDAWDGAIGSIETSKTPGSSAIELKRALNGNRGFQGSPSPDANALEKAINKMIDNRAGGVKQDTFRLLLAALVSELEQLLSVDDAAVFDYLAPVLRSARASGATIATLNYDLGVEFAAKRAGIDVSRGIDAWTETGRLDFPPNHLRLLKLHGSLDWAKVTSWRGIFGPSLEVLDEGAKRGRPPFLVFGQREKLRSEGPFLQLLEEFRGSLERHSRLVVLGYAFRDPHVNEIVGHWLHARPDSQLVVVDPYYTPPEQVYAERPISYRSQLVLWTREANTDRGTKVAWVSRSVKDFASELEVRGLDELLDDTAREPGDGEGSAS